MFIVAIVLMLSIDARLTLIALLPLPLVSVSVKFRQRDSHRLRAHPGTASDMSAVVQENARRRPRRPRLSAGAHEIERFRPPTTRIRRRNRVLIRLQGMFYPSMTFFLGFGAAGPVAGQPRRHRGRITLGEFVAFNAYLVMLSWPMIAFGWVTNILQRGMASWKRMLTVLDDGAAIGRR